MNSIKNFGLKFTLMLIALFSMNYASAQYMQPKLIVPTKVVDDYEPFDLTISMDNIDYDVYGMTFNISLGDNLEWADGDNTEPKADEARLIYNTHKINMSINSLTEAKVMVRATQNEKIQGESGAIMTIPLKVKKPYKVNNVLYDDIENGQILDITISNIKFATDFGGESGTSQDSFTSNVVFEPFDYTAYMAPDPITFYPSERKNVSFCLDNILTVNETKDAPVHGLSFVLTLPAGLNVDRQTIKNADRVFSRATIQADNRGDGKWFFMLSDEMGNAPLKSGIHTGPLFTFDVIADESFSGENATIELSDLEISAILNAEVLTGNCVNATVEGWYAANEALYNGVVEQINALQEKVNAALAQVKEENPEYNTAEWEEIFADQFKNMNEGAKQALEAAKEDGVVYSFLIDEETIDGMIEEMNKAAAADSDLRAANEASYNVVIAVLDEVQAQYEAALAQLKEEYPAVDFAEWEEMIPGQIEEQRTGAAQALAAANEDGVEFSYPFDNGEYILTMIEEMKNYAKASADQAALEAANAEACNAVLATIDGLQADFEAAVAEVKESYPDFEVAEYEEIVMGMLNQAREGAAQALAAANEDGVEFEFAYTGEDVQAVIEEMKTVAAREAANEAAYNDVIATIDALQAEYEAAVAEIKESHPDFDFTQWDEDIMGALNQAREGAAQALAAANEDGADFFFPYDGEDVKGMIEEMKNSVEGSAVEAIEAAVAAGKAKIFTLDGKQHNRPVVGEVNVIVRENSVSKIVIK